MSLASMLGQARKRAGLRAMLQQAKKRRSGGKRRIVRVEITDSESAVVPRGGVVFEGPDALERANDVFVQIALARDMGGGYSKTRVKTTWSDGSFWESRVDVMHRMAVQPNILGDWIRTFWTNGAKAEDGILYVYVDESLPTPQSVRAMFRSKLETYDLGPERPKKQRQRSSAPVAPIAPAAPQVRQVVVAASDVIRDLGERLAAIVPGLRLWVSRRFSIGDASVTVRFHRLAEGETPPNGIIENAPGLLIQISASRWPKDADPQGKSTLQLLRVDGSRSEWGVEIPKLRKYTSTMDGAQGLAQAADKLVAWFQAHAAALRGVRQQVVAAPVITPAEVEAELVAHDQALARQRKQRQQRRPAQQLPVHFASRDEISGRVAVDAFAGTSFVPERRGASIRDEFAQTMNATYAEMMAHAKTDAERELVEEEMAGLKAAYKRAYNTWLGARSGTTSWMITGRSGRNQSRERKKHETEMRRMQDVNDVLDKGKARILKRLKGLKRQEAGGVLGELRAKLADREALQETMKKANALVRKNVKLTATQQALPTEERQALIRARKTKTLAQELGVSLTRASKILEPDFMGRVGFPDYALKNNNAEVRRLKERIAEQQGKEQRAKVAAQLPEDALRFPFTGSESFPYAGTVEYDYGENRIRMSFDERIPREKFSEIRRTTGFNWSRQHEAFSAIMGMSAVYAARKITGLADLPSPKQGTKS